MPRILTTGSSSCEKVFLFAHGAGAPMDSLFMEDIAHGLAAKGWTVKRFEFPYMQERRVGGKKRPPNPAAVLMDSFHEVLQEIEGEALFIGGKSMGGRIASMLVDDYHLDGCICLGFPFYAPGKVSDKRAELLMEVKTPTLICQGERDPMGDSDTVMRWKFPSSCHFHWLADGDHGFVPRKKSGITLRENIDSAVNAIDFFSYQKRELS